MLHRDLNIISDVDVGRKMAVLATLTLAGVSLCLP